MWSTFISTWPFNPSLLKYQGGSEAAVYINQQNTQHYPVTQTGVDYNFPLAFYINGSVSTISPVGDGPMPARPFYLYTNNKVVSALTAKGWHLEPVKTFDDYWVSMLKPKFLNSGTRKQVVDTVQVVLVR